MIICTSLTALLKIMQSNTINVVSFVADVSILEKALENFKIGTLGDSKSGFFTQVRSPVCSIVYERKDFDSEWT